MCPSDPNMIRNIKASIDMVVNTPQVNDWDWIDAIQMAMPIDVYKRQHRIRAIK